jgi:hypothetical protein
MIVLSDPNFLNLPQPLAGIFAAAGRRSFFAQAGWYDLVARLAPELGSQIRLYADAEHPAAALVLRTDGARRLHSLANFYTIEHEAILADPANAAVAASLAGDIARESAAREAIRLTALDPHEPAFAAIGVGFKAAGWPARPHFEYGVWFEDTRGLDFRHYLEGRPGALRNTYRRRLARARSNRLDFRLSEPHSDIESFIADYQQIYARSWKEQEPFPDFMPALIRWSFATGALRMGVVRIDDVPAAAQFWLLWHGRAVIYKLAHDERYDSLSPGTLLTMRMMEHVLETDHPDEVNFGRGDDPYKKLWLPQRRERWGMVAANPRTLRGAATALRMLAGRIRNRLRPN